MHEMILTGLAVTFPSLSLAIVSIKRLLFYYNAVKQAVEVFNEVRENNSIILDRVKYNPKRKELYTILTGGIKKIQPLSG